MKIYLSPTRSDNKLTVEKKGDVLTVNGEEFNFGPLPDGATIKAVDIPCEWISGEVNRENGEIELTLILPHGPSPSQAVAFPETLENVEDGIVNLPFDTPEEKPTIDKDGINVEA